ncbi:MAG TPA: phosphomannose isomerase type II C-terminal cupin domain [Pyrinomonadaceae bacterium]|nr:phosphomannose isomerase type II C-terminal cupin domain [Pyrinomonadaceae bacterium]
MTRTLTRRYRVTVLTSSKFGAKLRRNVTMREFDRRPWGTYTVLEEDRNFKVKRIEVLPGQRLSYQKHAQRAEHWFVVEGTAKVTLDGQEITVNAGEAIDIPIGTAHRVENPGDVDLVFIEVQRGTYLGEDDIVRLQDDYGR